MQPTIYNRNDVLASNLLLVGLALGNLVLFIRIYVLHLPEPAIQNAMAIGLLLIGIVITALYYYAIRFGKKWARIVFYLLLAGGILFTVFKHDKLVSAWNGRDYLFVGNYMVGYMLQLWAAVLLLRRAEAHPA